ncbi:MAG: DUF4105 domain-containing protein [Planctomycetota bacterium]
MSVVLQMMYWLAAVPAGLWVAGAIFYDMGQKSEPGRALAIAWLLGVIAAGLLWEPVWQPLVALLIVLAAVIVWWRRIPPQSDRDWRDDLMRPPSAELRDNTVTIRDVRHSIYHSLDDVTPRFSDGVYPLDRLLAMDLLVSNWGSALMSHPFAIFEFGGETPEDEPARIGFSLEVRNLKGEGFSLWRNLYRQNELFCAAADERDLIRRRVEHEDGRKLYLYRLKIQPETMRIRFLEYVEIMNELAHAPQWYNALTTNCTTGVFRRYTLNKPPLDWRVLANGKLDEYLYQLGVIDTSIPFEDLKQACLINSVAHGHPDKGFGDAIRQGRPGFEAVTERLAAPGTPAREPDRAG